MTGLLLCAVLGGSVALTQWQEDRSRAVAGDAVDGTALPAAGTDGAGGASPGGGAGPSGEGGPPPEADVSPSPSPPDEDRTVAVPADGPGTFTTARTDGAAVGSGSRVVRYKVMVEDGIDIPAADAAAEVSAVLADERGWTRGGTHAFRLVSSGTYDLAVKIATPGTVDRICGEAGLLTRGEVNCRVGENVVVNLKRWVRGSPEFDGPIGDYRALIVNHEVGHGIGRGHETCPGPGEPAPAMMQQIKGLQGCVANAWPYDRSGDYLGGPPVP
ncbi:Protein of unknown function [Streptomyces prasinopilosus]|uniref:DUF3152 domain-containing protein n=2 Tax=Streptomyces prasinopilosus TaxID=67344 RepID=A0A1G6NPL7_9ACTN|nr:DUF3152 domain-containing protein [Streptomyces prasinopilosus]SDC69601.1 Protein of unknown function [Streptomyces prasinopilosus]